MNSVLKKILRGRKMLISLTLALGVLAATSELTLPEVHAARQTQKTNKTKSSNKTNKSQKTNKTKSSNKSNSKTGSTAKSGKAETSADVKRQQESTAREIRQTEQQIKENEAAVKKNLNELGKLEGDIDASLRRVASASAKVNALQSQIDRLESQISEDEENLAKLRAEYLKAVKAMRGKRKEKSALAFVFSSKNFNEAMRRMRYLKQFSAWRKKQTAEIDAHVARLKTQSAQLQQTKQMHDRELALEVKERDNLRTQYARQDAIVVELKKNGQTLRSHLAKKQAEANALKGRIASLIAEEQRKAEAEQAAKAKAEADKEAKLAAERAANEKKAQEQTAQNQPKPEKQSKPEKKKETKKPDKKTSAKEEKDEVSYAETRKRKSKTKEKSESAPSENAPKPASGSSAQPSKAAAATSGFEGMKGSLPRPVSGSFKVTSRFGSQTLPDMPGVTYDNPGIDAEVANGASAQAVYAGKVSGIYMIPGYSTVVIVNHGTYYTVYGNLSSVNVRVGDAVKSGQALGTVAVDDDDPSRSSIHFEVWKNREKLDPLKWIR